MKNLASGLSTAPCCRQQK